MSLTDYEIIGDPARLESGFGLDEIIRSEGYWWLPGANDNDVPGILEFDPDKGASLRLMGSLQGLEGITEPLDPELIHGLSSDGKLITLKDCGQTLGNIGGGGFSTSAYAVNTIFVGRYFERPEDVGFESLVVEYLHLGAWADSSGFDIKFVEEEREPKKRRIEVKHELPEEEGRYHPQRRARRRRAQGGEEGAPHPRPRQPGGLLRCCSWREARGPVDRVASDRPEAR